MVRSSWNEKYSLINTHFVPSGLLLFSFGLIYLCFWFFSFLLYKFELRINKYELFSWSLNKRKHSQYSTEYSRMTNSDVCIKNIFLLY